VLLIVCSNLFCMVAMNQHRNLSSILPLSQFKTTLLWCFHSPKTAGIMDLEQSLIELMSIAELGIKTISWNLFIRG
jgi:hypothetical protein